MENFDEREYHRARRAFIIMSEHNIMFAPVGSDTSHTQMLRAGHYMPDEISRILNQKPRGYLMNNELVLYQGDDMAVGAHWEVTENNYPLVRAAFPALKRTLRFDDSVRVFFGVAVGEPGTVWKTINPVSLGFFKRQK